MLSSTLPCPPSLRALFRPQTGGLIRLLCLCGLIALTGCKKDKVGKLVPVSGTVTAGGDVVNGGLVNYIPEEKKLRNVSVVGKIDKNGTYTLETNGKSGAPLGKYKITVSTNTPGAGNSDVQVNQIYQMDNTTTLTKEVTESAAKGYYDLHLEK
jgi:hypothetical protein